jgi:hypothetical protein
MERFAILKYLIIGGTAAAIFFRFSWLRWRLPKHANKKDEASATGEEGWDKRLTFCAVALASGAAIWTVVDNSEIVLENTNQAQISASFGIIQHIDERWFNEFANLKNDAIRLHATPEQVDQMITNNAELRTNIVGILGTLNDLAVAIDSRYVNEEVLYYELNPLVLWSSTNFAPRINDYRTIRHSNYYLVEFDDLAKAWGDERSLVTGRKFKGHDYINR